MVAAAFWMGVAMSVCAQPSGKETTAKRVRVLINLMSRNARIPPFELVDFVVQKLYLPLENLSCPSK